jgi:hypothetical protein
MRGTSARGHPKERDNETGLDYFGARYYASTQGRFTSPDPLLGSGRIENPQTIEVGVLPTQLSLNRTSLEGRLKDPSGETLVQQAGCHQTRQHRSQFQSITSKLVGCFCNTSTNGSSQAQLLTSRTLLSIVSTLI